MLRRCKEEEFSQFGDLAYELATDKTRSGYPCYSDEIKTKEMFLKRTKKAFSKNNEEILLFEYDGIIEGLIHYYWLADDKYLSTASFNIAEHFYEALKEFCDLMKERFPGYELYLGFSKTNTKATAYLKEHDFRLIDNANHNIAFLNELKDQRSKSDVIRINKDNYDLFRKLHREREGDMYYNSDRIYDDLDNWVILVKLKDDKAIASLYYILDDEGYDEIFGFDFKDGSYDPGVHLELLLKALKTAKESGAKYMIYFCEEKEQASVTKCGFKFIDQYVCYKRELN